MQKTRRTIDYRAELVRAKEAEPDADGTTEKPKSAIFPSERKALEWADVTIAAAGKGDRVMLYHTVEEMIGEVKK